MLEKRMKRSPPRPSAIKVMNKKYAFNPNNKDGDKSRAETTHSKGSRLPTIMGD